MKHRKLAIGLALPTACYLTQFTAGWDVFLGPQASRLLDSLVALSEQCRRDACGPGNEVRKI